MEAQTEVNKLYESLNKVTVPGGEKNQKLFDTATEKIGQVIDAQAIVTKAKLSENPKAVLQSQKAMLQDIAIDESGSLWDKIFDGTDLQEKLNSPELSSIIQNALQKHVNDAKNILKTAVDEAGSDVTESVKENVEQTAQKVDYTLTQTGDDISQTFTLSGETASVGIGKIGEGAQKASATAKPELDKVEKELDDIIIKANNADAATGAVGSRIKTTVPKNSEKDLGNMATSATQAATSLISMSTAISALTDNLKSGEVNIQQLLTSMTGIWMTANMAKTALTSLLPALGASTAAA